MSSNKKSLSALILLCLIIVGVSWFYFSKGQKSQQQEADETQATTTELNQGSEVGGAEANSIEGQQQSQEHAAPTHDGSNVANGQKGTIHELSIKPVLGRRAVGDPNAPVKIQEFFSLTCNHCANFHKGTYQALKEKFIDTGKVYFVYEEFPLNGPALYGSMIARCLPKERYEGFVDLLFRTQDKWAFGGDFKGALQQDAKLAGMSDEEFDACFNNKNLQKSIGENIKEASDIWKISATPSFIINDGARIFSGEQPIETFEKIIADLTGDKIVDGSENNVEKLGSESSMDMDAPPEPSEAQKEIWREMEAKTYDPETFKPSDEALKELKEEAKGAVTDDVNNATGGAADKVEETAPAVQ